MSDEDFVAKMTKRKLPFKHDLARHISIATEYAAGGSDE